jgi:regulator of cell morphogenesis and NO signaling
MINRPIDAGIIVNEMLRLYPATVSVLNAFGIDACCGGAASLAEAARRDGVDLNALLSALVAAAAVEEAAR